MVEKCPQCGEWTFGVDVTTGMGKCVRIFECGYERVVDMGEYTRKKQHNGILKLPSSANELIV